VREKEEGRKKGCKSWQRRKIQGEEITSPGAFKVHFSVG